jgi:hypothetical protein
MAGSIRVDATALRQHGANVRCLGGQIREGTGSARANALNAVPHAGHPGAQSAIESFSRGGESALTALGTHAANLALALEAAANGYEFVDNGAAVTLQRIGQ